MFLDLIDMGKQGHVDVGCLNLFDFKSCGWVGLGWVWFGVIV